MNAKQTRDEPLIADATQAQRDARVLEHVDRSRSSEGGFVPTRLDTTQWQRSRQLDRAFQE